MRECRGPRPSDGARGVSRNFFFSLFAAEGLCWRMTLVMQSCMAPAKGTLFGGRVTTTMLRVYRLAKPVHGRGAPCGYPAVGLNQSAMHFHTRSNSASPSPRCEERHRRDRLSLTRPHSKCSISSWKAPRAYT